MSAKPDFEILYEDEHYIGTGNRRRQQIRKHFAHIFHPIIGDKRHGDCKHNNYFRDHLMLDRMLLHAHTLGFQHPDDERRIEVTAPIDGEFERGLELTGLRGCWEGLG